MRSAMRLLFVVLFLFGLSLADDVEFRLYFRGLNTVKEVTEKVNNLVKRVNTDNQFIAAKTIKINCAEEEGEASEICKEVTNSPILQIAELHDNGISVKELINNHEDSAYKEVFRIFVNFCKAVFNSRAGGGQTSDWWTNLPEGLQEKISKYTLSSAEAVEEFKQKSLEKHSLLVCYLPDGFENLAAVFSTIAAAETVQSPIGLLVCKDSTEFCCQDQNLPKIVDVLKEKVYQTYDNQFEADKIADFVRTLRGPIVTKLSEEIVPSYRSGLLPDFPSQQDTVTMLFSPNKTNEPYRLFYQFANAHHGKYHLGALVDSGVYRWPHHPALITGKPKERVSQAFVNWEDLSEEGIRKFIIEGIHPSIHYVLDANAANTVFSLGKPILFFYDKTRKIDATAFAKLASEHKIRTSLASFAVINGRNLFSVYVADMLNIGHREASYILYLPEKKCAHFEVIEKQNEKVLESWLREKLDEGCDDHPVAIDPSVFAANFLWDRKKELLKQVHAPPVPSFHEEL